MDAGSHPSTVAPSELLTNPDMSAPPQWEPAPPPHHRDKLALDADAPLVQQRDEAYERMLEAVDALRGAQAEQAAARARVIELEHQVHVYLAENEHLRAIVAEGGRQQIGRRLAAVVRPLRPNR